ncbi:hypothetical protein AUC71_02440 [Methyloceanibacter marginalis]|uniref:Uncharacterized protein n=1 Tax=Methyloceanibacter marginalis TaxID=1774971 RepID=A0A1E3W8I4_9HYPH|nr:hypothetical protein [Methyloceanibacter marginalis]ODS02086.1 hypothetical protein AUC71_02440 [Methyloceanibacter marginalis]
MDKGEAYDKLIAALESAWKKTRRNHLHGQMLAVKAVDRFLGEMDAPRSARQPLIWTFLTLMRSDWINRTRGKPGPKPKSFNHLCGLSGAAAVVSVMKERCGCRVGDAVAKVAKATGIPGEEIRKFRDAIHRGTTDDLSNSLYRITLDEFKDASDDELDGRLGQLRIVYNDMDL